MPQIESVSVRYMRKIQVRDYEPAECEIALKAVVLDGEDAQKVADDLLEFTSAKVHDALGLPRSNKLPTRARGTETVKDGGGRLTEHKPVVAEIPDVPATGSAAPAQQASAPATTAPASDIPDTPKPAQAAPATATAASPAPAQQAPAIAEAVPQTPGELSKWVGNKVRENKITVAAITEIYPQFKVSRLVDLKPEQVPDCKKALDLAIAKHAASEGL